MNLAASNLIKEKDATESYTEIFDLIELCDRNEAVKIFNYCIREHKSKQYKTRFFINRKLIDVNLTFSIPFSEDDG
ncbi:MAG: hypothetical protein P8X73_07495, partial [Ignavibacteriaceae bacterium]